ncbi:farnesoic acid 0-methyl transferase domain-containing protein [Phthorimaea operculella]|nr:farnesoic acid 0-methyl transferase domain-containing protein [Phthorimaea operculella]
MVAANFTFDWRMATRCKEHICTHGYAYDKFYEVFEGDGIHNNNESVFEMHLAILASSNGHILLSNTPAPEANEEVYEIVVGGGGNKFTELRRNLRRNAKASAKTMGILSAIEFRAFYIKISDSGYIEFGREGDPLPVLSYNDLNPINVKFFSFAAWNGVEAKFLYDCPLPSAYNSTETTVPDSKMVEPKLSKTEALKRALLMDRNPLIPPEKTVDIDICYKITSVHYDSYTTKLTVGLAMVAEWTDKRLAWNPDKFNGTKILKFRQGEIWTPTFYVYNADDKGLLLNKNTELITMTKHGEATLHYQTSVATWCGVYPTKGSSRERWPNEVFDCIVIIGAWQPHERFVLHELDKNKLKVFGDIDQVILNDWEFKPYSSIVNISALRSVIQEDKEIHESDQLLIGFEMHRRATAFNIVFYTPLIVLVTFVLLSFWNESLQMSRVWFYSGCSVAVCAGFCFVDYLVPSHDLPNILILYTTVLMGVLVALLVQVLLMLPVVDRLCKTFFLQSVITSKWFRILFFLPAMKTCRNYDSINEAYASQEDDDSGVMVAPRNGNVEEMEAEANKYGEKEELAEALDKLMFFVYSVTFAVMLALHY